MNQFLGVRCILEQFLGARLSSGMLQTVEFYGSCGGAEIAGPESGGVCADEIKMTTPTTTRKMCAFFFTGLDRSRLTNLDRS